MQGPFPDCGPTLTLVSRAHWRLITVRATERLCVAFRLLRSRISSKLGDTMEIDVESPNLYCVRHVHACPRPPVRCLKDVSSHPPFSALTMRILTNSAWQVLPPFLLSYFTPRIPDKNSSSRGRQSSGSVLFYSSAGDGTRGPGHVDRSFTEARPPPLAL